MQVCACRRTKNRESDCLLHQLWGGTGTKQVLDNRVDGIGLNEIEVSVGERDCVMPSCCPIAGLAYRLQSGAPVSDRRQPMQLSISAHESHAQVLHNKLCGNSLLY